MARLEDIEFMLATKGAPFDRKGWIFEMKYDGFRVMCEKSPAGVRVLSRNRKDATSWFPEVTKALAKLKGSFILDGEVCMVDERGVPNFEALRMRSASRCKGPPALLYAFDLLAVGSDDLRAWPLLKRKERLRKLIPKDARGVGFIDYVPEAGKALYEAAVQMGMEGVVGKREDSPYVPGRSKDWIKSKPAGFHNGWDRPLATKP